jgi:4,5-DOPA dioxygenase extradiol
VFQLSLDYSFNDWHPKPMQYHYDLARELADLRDRGVLIIGSGNIVHNLGILDFANVDAVPYGWAQEFDEKVRENLVSGNDKALIRYENMGSSSSLAVPTPDHYLPMIYAIALRQKDEPLSFTYKGFHHASISMRCFQIG